MGIDILGIHIMGVDVLGVDVFAPTRGRHPQSITEGLQHTTRVLGTGCTGSIKVARFYQQRRALYEEKENP